MSCFDPGDLPNVIKEQVERHINARQCPCVEDSLENGHARVVDKNVERQSRAAMDQDGLERNYKVSGRVRANGYNTDVDVMGVAAEAVCKGQWARGEVDANCIRGASRDWLILD
jgi:hypothetical protein